MLSATQIPGDSQCCITSDDVFTLPRAPGRTPRIHLHIVFQAKICKYIMIITTTAAAAAATFSSKITTMAGTLVVGGGYVALECAGLLSGLGHPVTLMHRRSMPMLLVSSSLMMMVMMVTMVVVVMVMVVVVAVLIVIIMIILMTTMEM
jgi:hypothetical protein